MIKLLRVTGDSLLPWYQEGDFVFVSKIPFLIKPIMAGDILVFKHPEIGVLIKEVERVDAAENKLFVRGTHENSVDSRQIGPIYKEAVVGKVIWHVKRPA